MDDVLFTFNHYIAHNVAVFQKITGVEAVSDTSIRLTFDEPTAFGFMHQAILTFYLLSKHIWENAEDPRTYAEPDAAIGADPFRLVEIDKTAHTTWYEAVEDYPIGEITIDRVELRGYENHSALIMAMINDEVDVMHTYSFYAGKPVFRKKQASRSENCNMLSE